MANNKTLYKAIERCDKRIAQARKKLRWSDDEKDREKARQAITENQSKKLRLEQQIIFNNIQRK